MVNIKTQPGPVYRGDRLEEIATGQRFVVIYGSTSLGSLILRPADAPHDQASQRSLSFDDLTPTTWRHLPRTRKGVNTMARTPTQNPDGRRLPALPKMTRAEWLKRDKTSVTLTRGELDHLAQLLTAGRSLIRDGRPISPKLKAAMTRLGLSTTGL